MKMKVYICKKNNLTSYALAAKALLDEKGIVLDQNKLYYNEKGKPYFNNNEIFFNISHSGEYVVCAFDESEIGIDIQKVRDISDRVLNKYLHCRKDTPEEKTLEWTKYESYGKRKGCGIPYSGNYENGYFIYAGKPKGYITTVCVSEEKKYCGIELIYV